MARHDNKTLLHYKKHKCLIRLIIQRHAHLDPISLIAFHKPSHRVGTEAFTNRTTKKILIVINILTELLKKINVSVSANCVDMKERILSVLKAKGEELCVATQKV